MAGAAGRMPAREDDAKDEAGASGASAALRLEELVLCCERPVGLICWMTRIWKALWRALSQSAGWAPLRGRRRQL